MSEDSMIGLCHKCHSSGISQIVDEETSDTICDNCRK